MRLRNISLLVLALLAFTSPSWAIGIAGSAGGKRVTVSVDGTWQGTYAAGTTYAIGDIVTDGTTNYRSLQNSNTGHTPASSPLYWQAILTKGDAGPTGATGSQGPTGAAGADGKTVLTTSGAPASGTGVNGDYAYDPDTYTMYGPKAAGVWPAGTIIKGADGAGFTGGSDGTYGWLTDSNTSSYTECASGKYGLNFVGGVLYQCSDGTNSVFTPGDSLPTQTGNSGKYLTTNGTAASWGSIAAGSGIAISADIPTETGAANLNDSTHVLTVASTTGYTQFTGSFTAWDTTPDAFAFTDETDVAISTAKISNAITVAGINYPAAISVTGDTGYGYSKNSAACTATSGTVVVGDTVAACVTSSGSNSTATTATVAIGGVSDTYSVTAVAGSASYTTYFSNDFGCSDSGTVYTCASPTTAWTSETDASSIGAIVSGKYVITETAQNLTSYVTVSGLTTYASTQITFDLSMDTTAGTQLIDVCDIRSSAAEFRLRLYSSGSNYNNWQVQYYDGANALQTANYAYSFTAGHTYTVRFSQLHSTTTSSGDGGFALHVSDNGGPETTVANVSSINTYNRASNRLDFGIVAAGGAITKTLTFDNVVLGHL